MAVDAEKLDQETDAELAALMGMVPEAPDEQDKPTDQNPPADELPPPPAPEPDAATDEESEPPTPDPSEDWQDKYTKAEESRKNAHALMTQATQKAADLERSNSDLQRQMAMLQAKVDLLSQQRISQQGSPSSNSEPASSDQFQELRKDYQELDPVFNKLDESEQLNQKLEQRLAAIEQARKEQEAEQARQAFWEKVRSLHPDVEQISASEDFKGWFARQGADVQELSRVSPLGAAQVMTLYKESAGLNAPKPNPAQKMQQAKQMSEPPVRSRSKPTTQGRQPAMTLDQIAAMPQKEFNDNEEKLDEILAQWIKQGGRL